MTDGLPTLTIWQPYASLIVPVGVKTIETRSWSAPEHLIGQRIGIHAAKREPYLVEGTILAEHAIRAGWPRLSLGELLGTVRLVACVPMVDEDGDLFEHEPPCLEVRSPGSVNAGLWLWNDPADDEIADVSDQRPYGDFAPGRWAWLLEDPQPTTSQCPWCAGRGGTPEEVPIGRGDVFPDPGWMAACPTCDGAGRCDPIPARGRQRVWYWTPTEGDRR